MLNIKLIAEYQRLFLEVPQLMWILAHTEVSDNITLPKRGPAGHPVNEDRINIFVEAVIQQIHTLQCKQIGNG